MKKAFITLMLIFLILSASGCKDKNAKNLFYKVNDSLMAEVGYEFDLSKIEFENDGEQAIEFEIFYNSGIIEKIGTDNIFMPKSVGKYLLKCTLDNGSSCSVPIEVVDTECPFFEQVYKVYSPTENMNEMNVSSHVKILKGNLIDLNSIFVPKDNSGECSAVFNVEKGGTEKIELIDGTFTAEETDFYLVEATAFDNSGNSFTGLYRLYVA